MRGRSSQISLTVVAILLGLLLVMQLRTQGRIAKSVAAQSATDQATMISSLYDSNLNLRGEVEKLRSELSNYDGSPDQRDIVAMIRELNNLRIINGLRETTGPGVQLTAIANLKAEDLQDLVNELRNAGAEAIALNGKRVVVKTAIYADGPALYVDGDQIGPPYVLLAIGQPDTLEKALLRKGGLVTYLQNTYPDATISVMKRANIALPAYQKSYEWQNATPAN